MITYYKNVNGKITEIKNYEVVCWINCTAPDDDEIDKLIVDFKIDPDFLKSALDEEESSHIDCEDGNILIVVVIPVCAQK